MSLCGGWQEQPFVTEEELGVGENLPEAFLQQVCNRTEQGPR